MADEISLKDYVDIRLLEIEKSTSLARQSMEARLSSMNEFRDALKDQAGRFITRTEMEAKLDKVKADISALQKIVWIGVGASLALQFLLKFLIK